MAVASHKPEHRFCHVCGSNSDESGTYVALYKLSNRHFAYEEYMEGEDFWRLLLKKLVSIRNPL